VVGAGETWHQWVDTGVFALHIPSRPGLSAPSRRGAHAHFLLSHQNEARTPPQPAPVWLWVLAQALFSPLNDTKF
jgi:hypothetical protein